MSSDDRRRQAIEALQKLAEFYGGRSTANAITGEPADSYRDADAITARRAARILGPKQTWQALNLNPANAPETPEQLLSPDAVGEEEQQQLGQPDMAVSQEAREPEDSGGDDSDDAASQQDFASAILQQTYEGGLTPSLYVVPSNVDGTYRLKEDREDRVAYIGPVIRDQFDDVERLPEEFEFNRWCVLVRNMSGEPNWRLEANVCQGENVSRPVQRNVIIGNLDNRADAVEALDDYLSDLTPSVERDPTRLAEEPPVPREPDTRADPDFGDLEPEVIPGAPEIGTQQTLGGGRASPETQETRGTRPNRGQRDLRQAVSASDDAGEQTGIGGEEQQQADDEESGMIESEQEPASQGGLAAFGEGRAGAEAMTGDTLPGPASGDSPRDRFGSLASLDLSNLNDSMLVAALHQFGHTVSRLNKNGALDPALVHEGNELLSAMMRVGRERELIGPNERNKIMSAYADIAEADSSGLRNAALKRYHNRVEDATGQGKLEVETDGGLSARLSRAFETMRERGFDRPFPSNE